MAERPVVFQGANLGLSIAIAIVVCGGGLLLLGPGRSHVHALRADLSAQLAALERWQHDRTRFRPPSREERAAWAASWESLNRRIPAVANDPELVATVSEALHAPSVRKMQVEPQGAHDEDASGEVLKVVSPVDDTTLVLRPVPLAIAFHSSFRDASAILGRIEARRLPARLESLRVRRDYPGVEVAMDVTYFVRDEGVR